MSTTTTAAPKTAEALHAEAKEIRRKREALQAAVNNFQRQIAELDEQIAALRIDVKIAIEREDGP
jgi:uncharacterized coiled-coil DUF342 family protein